MADIYEFKGKDEPEEESCDCEYCQLALEFIDYVKDCESDEDLFIVLRGLVTESAKLQLKEYLNKQIQNSIELIDILESDFE